MAETVRWSLHISRNADTALRAYLERRGFEHRDLSKFVEDAVRWRLLDEAVAETKAANAAIPPEEIEAAIEEAVQAVRAERFRS
jgi:hypothetical protein